MLKQKLKYALCKISHKPIFNNTAIFTSFVRLCISQFHLSPAPPPPATAGHLPALAVPGVGYLQILALPGDLAFANHRAISELLTRTRFPIII